MISSRRYVWLAVIAAAITCSQVHAAPLPTPAYEQPKFDFTSAISKHIDSDVRFAEPLIKRVDAKTKGGWTQDGQMVVWQYAIEVPGAVSMGFYADDVSLPADATVKVVTDQYDVIYGADRFSRGTLITTAQDGSKMLIQVRMPATARATARFSIDRFNIGYKSLSGGADHPMLSPLKAAFKAKNAKATQTAAGTSDTDNTVCDRNFVCERANKASLTDPGQAIIGLQVDGVAFCSANLMMDVGGSFTPFFTTGAHCINYGDGGTPPSDAYVMFWSQETACGSALNFISRDPSMQSVGAVVRSMYQDGLLLEGLSQPPFGANPYYAGWNATDVTNYDNHPSDNVTQYCDPNSSRYDPTVQTCRGIKEQALFGVHHGRTRTKQYAESGTVANSSGAGSVTYAFQDTMPGYTKADGTRVAEGPVYDTWLLRLTPSMKTGRIAGGSSGSGLWYEAKKQIIGTLSASGTLGCSANDGVDAFYQRYQSAYNGPAGATSSNAQKFWLDPRNTGITERNGSYNGARAGSSTVDFTTTTAAVTTGDNVTLNWSTAKAGFCRLSGAQLTEHGVSANGTETFSTNQDGNFTYSLSCRNDAQVVTTKTVQVNITPGNVKSASGPGLSLTIGNDIPLGASATLTWNTASATTSCTASNAWSGAKSISGGTESVTPTAVGAYTYTLNCKAPPTGGLAAFDTTVSVNLHVTTATTPPPAPSLSFTNFNPTITLGDTANLGWSGDATSCTASNAWTGAKPGSGNENVTPTAAGSYIYTLTCNKGGAESVASVNLQVNAPVAPTLTFTADRTSATIGDTATVFISSANATACTASGGWTGNQTTSGQGAVSVSRIGTNTYTLTCTGRGGSVVKSLSITGNAVPSTPPAPAAGGGGGSFGLLSLLMVLPGLMRKRRR